MGDKSFVMPLRMRDSRPNRNRPNAAFRYLKAAVGRDISVSAATAFQSQVASPWLEARGSAQGAALEEGLESSREDFAPAMQDRQLLRIFDQATQELGDGAKRLGGGNRAGMRAGDSDRRLSRMA